MILFRKRSLTLAALAVLAAVTAALGAPAVAEAQLAVPRASVERPRFIIGADVVMTEPRRELAQYIGDGWGLNFTGMVRVEPQGLLHVRFDGGSARYGTDTRRFSYGFRSYELSTTNNIDWFALGPEITIPGGPLRPYANAAVSLTRFRTTSSIRDRTTQEEFDSVDNASDFTVGWVLGGGTHIPLGSRSPIALTVGARYHLGGEANFVREEDVRDAPLDADRFPASRSHADFVVWQLGITYRLPQIRTSTPSGLR
jgi:opacity protein-like surface antigen